MRRNFALDQILLDRLYANNTSAFEELYRRYWFSLYIYSFTKLRSTLDAKAVVRNVFVSLWNKRSSLPLTFSLSSYLYQEIRSEVIKCINLKLQSNNIDFLFSNQGFVDFENPTANKVQHHVAYKQGASNSSKGLKPYSFLRVSWLEKQYAFFRFKGWKQMFQTLLNF